MNYNPSGNKPRLSAAECFRWSRLAAITRRRRYNYRPLNNLIGKMIDTTITRNQNRVGAIRPPRAATEGAATNPTIAHRRFNQVPGPNGFLSSLNCNNRHCFCLCGVYWAWPA